MPNKNGTIAKGSSFFVFAFARVTAPAALSVPPATKLAVAEKHIINSGSVAPLAPACIRECTHCKHCDDENHRKKRDRNEPIRIALRIHPSTRAHGHNMQEHESISSVT